MWAVFFLQVQWLVRTLVIFFWGQRPLLRLLAVVLIMMVVLHILYLRVSLTIVDVLLLDREGRKKWS
jgi:hypothetical protein